MKERKEERLFGVPAVPVKPAELWHVTPRRGPHWLSSNAAKRKRQKSEQSKPFRKRAFLGIVKTATSCIL